MSESKHTAKHSYIVVCQTALCNSSGVSIHYGWDGEVFRDRSQAIKHGFEVRESDDFNIGVLSGRHLVSFDWMDKPVGDDAGTMREIAAALGLKFRAAISRALGEDDAS